MKDLVKFPLESGGFIYIETEVTQAEKGGLVKAGRGLPDEAAQSFEAAINSFSPIANTIVSKLMALLQLEGALPLGVAALSLGSSDGSAGHDFQTFGRACAKALFWEAIAGG